MQAKTAFQCTHTMGGLAPSLHRESTDSLIFREHILNSIVFVFTGTRDSSGIRFFYSSQPREHDAGILEVGHEVDPFMFIPPNTPNYIVGGMCIADCTNRVIEFCFTHCLVAFTDMYFNHAAFSRRRHPNLF